MVGVKLFVLSFKLNLNVLPPILLYVYVFADIVKSKKVIWRSFTFECNETIGNTMLGVNVSPV